VSSTDGPLTADGTANSTDTHGYENPANLAIAITPDGAHLFTATPGAIYVADQINEFAIDPTTGAATFDTQLSSGTGALGGQQSLAVSPSGNALYVVDGDDPGVTGTSVSAYPLTGGVAGTRVDVPAGTNPGALAVAPNGRTLYAGRSSSVTASWAVPCRFASTFSSPPPADSTVLARSATILHSHH